MNAPLDRFRSFVHGDRDVRGTLVGAESSRRADDGRTANRATGYGDFSGRRMTETTPLSSSMQTRTRDVDHAGQMRGGNPGTSIGIGNGDNRGDDLNMSYEELLRLDEDNVEIGLTDARLNALKRRGEKRCTGTSTRAMRSRAGDAAAVEAEACHICMEDFNDGDMALTLPCGTYRHPLLSRCTSLCPISIIQTYSKIASASHAHHHLNCVTHIFAAFHRLLSSSSCVLVPLNVSINHFPPPMHTFPQQKTNNRSLLP